MPSATWVMVIFQHLSERLADGSFGGTLPLQIVQRSRSAARRSIQLSVSRDAGTARSSPDHFADLSLAVIKLMGPGEYVLERPGDHEQGHFGLAVQDYTHSTAPNRRFADVVTQRLVKTFLTGTPGPYTDDELAGIANNCT